MLPGFSVWIHSLKRSWDWIIITNKLTKTKWSNKFFILRSVHKWKNLTLSVKTVNSNRCHQFLLDQHETVPVNRQKGLFKSYFYLWERTCYMVTSKNDCLVNKLFHQCWLTSLANWAKFDPDIFDLYVSCFV